MNSEFDLFGVYLSSVPATSLIAFAMTFALHQLFVRLGVYRHVWHPALFETALFVILWAAIVLPAESPFQ